MREVFEIKFVLAGRNPALRETFQPRLNRFAIYYVAERGGFEPPELALNRLVGDRTRPLCDLSRLVGVDHYINICMIVIGDLNYL
jgi:hypothetical protein